MRVHRLALLAAASLASLSCDGGPPADFYVRGTGIVVATDAPFAGRPDFRERLESTLGAALAYWGGDFEQLAGMTVTLSGEPSVMCGDGRSLGCFDRGEIRITTVDPAIGTFRCVEQTVLVHEVGHAVIGDLLHEDPRWMELDPVRDALSGRVGYGPAGERDCPIFLSVWRHVRGAP